jgi:glycosyltransferase involved in cell wall biosynthesis
MPVYNEEKTVGEILKKVVAVDLGQIKKEIIVINDGSKDRTRAVLEGLVKKGLVFRLVNLSKNRGKGSAVRTGLKYVTGEAVVIQDGDSEYEPNDFKKMIEEMLRPRVLVVYGSRRLEKRNKKYSGFNFFIGGLLLTYLTNILFGSRITDEPTCYKMFETKFLKSFKLKAKRFEFCPEVTANVLKRGVRISEVPILYHPRTTRQGKKIKLNDFFKAAGVLIKVKFFL